MLVVSPLFAIVCIAINLDSPGPIFRREPSIGPSGRCFQTLEFRTSGEDPRYPKSLWAQEVTRLGHFLRYTRIDALPQLINVLRGDMSLIDSSRNRPDFLD